MNKRRVDELTELKLSLEADYLAIAASPMKLYWDELSSKWLTKQDVLMRIQYVTICTTNSLVAAYEEREGYYASERIA